MQALVKRDEKGQFAGIWGAMSDLSRSFRSWEDHFSKGLYLAGVECADDAEAPEGWTKWTIPGYEYLRAEVERENAFSEVLDFMQANGISLVGAVYEFFRPGTGKSDLFFPIRKL